MNILPQLLGRSARLVATLHIAALATLNIPWRLAPHRSASFIPPQIKDYELGIPVADS
jgi:hypothetical protein